MRGLIDTNVVLYFLQERQPFVEDAAFLFNKVDTGEVRGFIAATTITNIYYIVCRAAGVQAAIDAITQILTDLYICVVDRSVLEQALALNFRDFEDAVQYASGMAHGVDVNAYLKHPILSVPVVYLVFSAFLLLSANKNWKHKL